MSPTARFGKGIVIPSILSNKVFICEADKRAFSASPSEIKQNKILKLNRFAVDHNHMI